MIYFLFGTDTYRSREKLNELIAKNGKGFDLRKINAADLSLNELKKQLSCDTLFAKKKFLVIWGLLDKNLKNKEAPLGIKFLSQLKFPKDEILIFLDSEIDKRTALFKLLTKKADEQYEFGKLSPFEMDIWLRKKATDLNLKINQENRKKIAAMLGDDSWLAVMELKKLKAYKGENEVNYKDIDLLLRGKLDDDIFKLTDEIAKNNKKDALKLLHNQLELGNNEIYLLTMFVRQFRILIQIKSAMESGANQIDNYNLAINLGLHPFVVQKSLLITKHYSLAQLKIIYNKLLEIDLKIKTSKIPGSILLEKFILEI